MNPPPHNVVRIAHAFGNNRPALRQALAADVDMIEVDMWYRGGDLFIHHERKMRWLPLLVDRQMATHQPGRFAIRFGDYYVRPDFGTIHLDELLGTVAGRKRLLLDVKGHYQPPHVDGYVETLIQKIRDHKAEPWVAVCGQTYTLLHRLRELAPDIQVRYSIERPYQWERFQLLIEQGVHQICMSYRFLDDAKARVLQDVGADVYCWTVDDPATAMRLVSEGVDGIISNNLDLLAALP